MKICISRYMKCRQNCYCCSRKISFTNISKSHSSQANKLLLGLIAECNYDFLSARLPNAVLRWLFHQNKIEEFLMSKILNLCRCFCNAKIIMSWDFKEKILCTTDTVIVYMSISMYLRN